MNAQRSQMSDYYGRRSLSSNATAMDGRSYLQFFVECNTPSYVVARECGFESFKTNSVIE